MSCPASVYCDGVRRHVVRVAHVLCLYNVTGWGETHYAVVLRFGISVGVKW